MPSTENQTFVIVGAGAAGAKAAEALREEGFDGRLVLVGSEAAPPYARPPLSKGYLRGELDRRRITLHDEGFYAAAGIDLRLARTAERLDLPGRRVVLDDGEALRFDRLLLATGAQPRRLPIPGAELEGVHVLRDLEDADALRARLDRGGSVVVVGAGWLGCEFAASARQRGLAVTVVDPAAAPLERVLGAEVGSRFRDLHADHGVRMRLGTGVEAFEGATAVERVRTTDGAVIDCDFAVAAVGVEPRTALAAEAGIAVANGIPVDERLRTSAPGVFAAGDIANAHHRFYGEQIRVEHWATARDHGAIAARGMLGRDAAYEALPRFSSS